jgi:hypothetical protein
MKKKNKMKILSKFCMESLALTVFIIIRRIIGTYDIREGHFFVNMART